MVTVILVSTFWWNLLQATVGEIPNKHLSLVSAQKRHVFYFKHALKLIKIETLRALSDQDLSPKIFKFELGRTVQKKIQIWLFQEFHWTG
jgi:uncharacterized damage-inducible protein DinB